MFNWEAIIAEAGILKTEYFLWSLVVAYILVRVLVPSHIRRLQAPMGATIIAILLVPVSAYMRRNHTTAPNEAHIAAVSLGILAIVWEFGTLFFGVLETRFRLNVPRIVSDLIVAAVSVGAIALLLSRLGMLSMLVTYIEQRRQARQRSPFTIKIS